MKRLFVPLVTAAFALATVSACAQDLGSLFKSIQEIGKLVQDVKPTDQKQATTTNSEQAPRTPYTDEANSLLSTISQAYRTSSATSIIPSDCLKQQTIDTLVSDRREARRAELSVMDRTLALMRAIRTAAYCGQAQGAGTPWTEYLAVDMLAYYRTTGYMSGGLQPEAMYAVGRHFGGYDLIKEALEKNNIFDPSATSREDRAEGAADFSVTADKFLEESRSGNALAFQTKYENKVVAVSGTVFLVAPMKDMRGQNYVFLSMKHSDKSRFVGLSVSCSTYDTATIERLKTLEPKKAYKVQGLFATKNNTSMNSGISLEKCSLVSKL